MMATSRAYQSAITVCRAIKRRRVWGGGNDDVEATVQLEDEDEDEVTTRSERPLATLG